MTTNNINQIVRRNFAKQPWILTKSTGEIVNACVKKVYREMGTQIRKDATNPQEHMAPIRSLKSQERHYLESLMIGSNPTRPQPPLAGNRLLDAVMRTTKKQGLEDVDAEKKEVGAPSYKMYGNRRFNSSGGSSKSSVYRRFDDNRRGRVHNPPPTHVSSFLRSFGSTFGGTKFGDPREPERNQTITSRLGSLPQAAEVSELIMRDLMPIDRNMKHRIAFKRSDVQVAKPRPKQDTKPSDPFERWNHPPSVEKFMGRHTESFIASSELMQQYRKLKERSRTNKLRNLLQLDGDVKPKSTEKRAVRKRLLAEQRAKRQAAEEEQEEEAARAEGQQDMSGQQENQAKRRFRPRMCGEDHSAKAATGEGAHNQTEMKGQAKAEMKSKIDAKDARSKPQYKPQMTQPIMAQKVPPMNQQKTQMAPQMHSQMKQQTQQQMNPQKHTQMHSQMNPQMNPQMRPQMPSQMPSQMNPQMSPQMHSQIKQYPQMNPQMQQQLNQQINPQMKEQMYPQMKQQLHPQMKQQMQPQTNPQMRQQSNPQMREQPNPQMKQQMHYPQMHPQINPQMRQQLNAQMKPQMKPQAKPQAKQQMRSQTPSKAQLKQQMRSSSSRTQMKQQIGATPSQTQMRQQVKQTPTTERMQQQLRATASKTQVKPKPSQNLKDQAFPMTSTAKSFVRSYAPKTTAKASAQYTATPTATSTVWNNMVKKMSRTHRGMLSNKMSD